MNNYSRGFLPGFGTWKLKYPKFLIILLISILGCNKNDDGTEPIPDEPIYFPSNADNTWETKSLSSLDWNGSAV